MDKPKAQLGFFWDGNSLPLGSAGWAVQTSDSTKIGFSHLFWSSLLLDFTLLYPVFSPCSPPKKKKSLDSLPIPKGANWQADVLQKGYAAKTLLFYFQNKSCGALFILEYFYFLCTTYNHVLLTEIYFKEKKEKKNLEVFFKKKYTKIFINNPVFLLIMFECLKRLYCSNYPDVCL